MTASSAPRPATVAFDRLRTLTKRGYAPNFSREIRAPDFVGIEMVHVKKTGTDVPPPLTVWSDGTVATSGLLWPKQYVHSDEGPPEWQRVIFAEESERFDSFAKSVPLPTLKDRYFNPAVFEGQVFTGRLIFGSTLCVLVASSIKLGSYFV